MKGLWKSSITEFLEHLHRVLKVSILFVLMPPSSQTGLYKLFHVPGQRFLSSAGQLEQLITGLKKNIFICDRDIVCGHKIFFLFLRQL